MSDSFRKGGVGSGRKGHHSIGQDYSDVEHDSVFEDSQFDSTQERMLEMDHMKEIMARNDERALQRIKEKEQAKAGGHGMSRKTPPKYDANKILAEYKAKNKPSLWRRLLGKSEDSSMEKAKKKESLDKNLETLYHMQQLMKKGGVGSGKRGHSTADHSGIEGGGFTGPASDTDRQMPSSPGKYKKIIAGDRKTARKDVKGHSPEELQSKIDSHKEMSESKFLSPASRESYSAKHQALLGVQKKQNKAKEITKKPEPSMEGVAVSKPGPFGGISKAEFLQKFLAGAAIKTGVRIAQNLIKPASSKGGEKADQVPGTGLAGGPSVAAGGGTGAAPKASTGPSMTKSILDRFKD